MNITDLKSGDDILITMLRSRPANAINVSGDVIYSTKGQYKRNSPAFTGGRCIVLSNSDKILKVRFRNNTNYIEGVAELEYNPIRDIHIW